MADLFFGSVKAMKTPPLYPTQNHPSFFHRQKIVYPVVSRRSGGVSIGINLSPSKRCNFGCVYCQVHLDRVRNPELLSTISPKVDLSLLEGELRQTVGIVRNGSLFHEERFAATPEEKRVLRDFAFSGDGEPTLSPQFAEASAILARVRREERLDEVKLILITNATTLREPETVKGCDILAENNGDIWGKLDGGSEDHYRRMNRSTVPYGTILENLAFAASRWPVSIQTMLLTHDGIEPTDREIDDYVRTIEMILEKSRRLAGRDEAGSNNGIRRILLYTVARVPVEMNVAALRSDEMDRFADKIRTRTGLETDVFYSH